MNTADRELMQAILEAMEHLHRTGDTQVFDMYAAPEIIPALRERLAQPEQEPDPIGDAQDKLIAEMAAQPEQEPVKIDGNTSDGYHTFNELYEFRKAYNAVLFNEWAAGAKCSVHKSWRHHDGELCFGGGWFIVVAVLPEGQISNHYEARDWDLFAVPETECALFEFDGHTSSDVVARLKAYTTPPAAQRQHVTDGSPCWCEPETSYTDPETGASVIVHKGPQ
jgi:hypothetical protein